MDNLKKKETSLAEKRTDDPSEKIADELREKNNRLMGNFNVSFHELTKQLELEQAKLLELEDRRKKIQEEMKKLKIEIHEEKASFEEDMERVAKEHITQASLPDPIDVISYNIELKSEFMRTFLATKTAELKSQLQRGSQGSPDELYDIKEESEEDIEDSARGSEKPNNGEPNEINWNSDVISAIIKEDE